MELHLIKEVRDIKRFEQIVATLFEEGFEFLVDKLKLGYNVPLVKRLKSKLSKKQQQKKHEVMLRKTLEKLGPTFVKFGQLLSVRPDLVPKEYCKELEKLQDNVQQIPFSDVKEIVEKELNSGMEKIFRRFEKNPVASASLSQVHKAVLKSGEVVAVKVQRKNIRQIMETDIEIMHYIASLTEKHSEDLRKYRPVKVVDEFRQWTEKELDFRMEARNALRFYENFRESKTVKIPKVYTEHSTEKVLVMEYIEGVQLHDTAEIRKNHLDFKKIMENSFDAIMTQVFVHGIFHADPHPGNILVLKDNSIAFVDFGIVGYFDHKLKEKSVELIYGIITHDEDKVMDVLQSMGMETGEYDYEELKADIGFAIQPLENASIKDVKISKVLEDVMQIALKHHIKVPTPFVLFGKTILTLEGIALEFDPNFKVIETTRPFIEKIIAKKANPVYALKSFMHNVQRYKRFVEELPEKADKAFEKIQKGSIKVDIEDTDIKKLALEMDRSSNRVAYGLLITGFLISSALLMNLKGPTIFGIPFLSFFSFVFASILLFILFVSIVREKFRHFV